MHYINKYFFLRAQVVELREALVSRGLETQGTKSILINRLKEYIRVHGNTVKSQVGLYICVSITQTNIDEVNGNIHFFKIRMNYFFIFLSYLNSPLPMSYL